MEEYFYNKLCNMSFVLRKVFFLSLILVLISAFDYNLNAAAPTGGGVTTISADDAITPEKIICNIYVFLISRYVRPLAFVALFASLVIGLVTKYEWKTFLIPVIVSVVVLSLPPLLNIILPATGFGATKELCKGIIDIEEGGA